MSLDVWKFVLDTTRLRRRTPMIRCSSGQPATHQALADVECDPLGPISLQRVYICQDAVDTVRLLQVTRRDLLEEGKAYGATILIDEAWTCEIYRRKEDRYEVKVFYEGTLARASKTGPNQPVAAKEAKRIRGVMTILEYH